ncbi:hypothetical protein [Dactylosporangium sp. CA-233914]|uniref:hypothetical protein n=1 Tax=Dactylosporangium sp. CA-233914 TaxID=3239934 RepID=UPI003D8A5BB1
MVSGRPATDLATAEPLRAALPDFANRDAFTRRGFRGVDGASTGRRRGVDGAAGSGVSRAAVQVVPMGDGPRVLDVLGNSNATTGQPRVLTLVDVASSMTRPIAKGGSSRLEVLRRAAIGGARDAHRRQRAWAPAHAP